MNPRVFVAIGLGSVLLPGLAAADAPPATAADCKPGAKATDPCKPTEVVVTGTRTPESSQRATVRTEFVTRQEAERRGATNVAEALQGEPALQVNPESYGYLGRPSGAQIQGLDADRVLVLEDGERVVGDSGGVVDLSQLPLADVERIEYVMGPTSSLYGTNALGGVINVISAPPRALGPSVRYRAEGRNTGEALGSVSGAYRVDDSWVALDTSLHHRPGIALDESKPDLFAPAWTSTLVGLRAGAKVDRDVEVRLKARWVRDYSEGVSSKERPGLDRVYITDLPQTTDRFSVRAQETLQLGGGKRLDFSLARSWFLDSSDLDLRNSPLDEERSRKLLNQGLEAVLTVPDGRSRTWVVGARCDAERFQQSLERTLPDLSVEHVTEIPSTLLASGAVYGQLGWKLTERWTVMPGLRLEVHDNYGAVAAPRLASAYQLSEVFSVRAALGRGFRAPSAKEYGFLFDHSALGYRVLGNPDLEPETSWGGTADATARTGKLRARIGGFVNRVKDMIILDRSETDFTADGVTDYVYRNVDEAITAGADLSLRYKVLPQASFEGGYAYVWTRDLGAQEPLPDRPPETITLAVYLELGKLTGNVRYRHVTSAFAGTIDEEELRTPSFGTLDARLAYAVLAPLELYVGALNITDVQRDPNDPVDTRPAQGRQFYLGLSGELPSE
jgi:outer membrane receptor for ferrienterochelin and colicins